MKSNESTSNEERFLHGVYLEDFAYPCIVYVLKRIGLSIPPTELLNQDGTRFVCEDQLEKGDVLIWDHRSPIQKSDAMLTILPSENHNNQTVLTTKIDISTHFCVYEGDGLVSDTTFDKELYYPRIRVVRLAELSRQPERMLRYTDLLKLQVTLALREQKGNKHG